MYYARSFNLEPILMQYLFLHGINNFEKIYGFIYPSLDKFHNPYLLNDMKIAVTRILKAIKNQEKILIFGDYDADGITSTALLYQCLKIFGANVSFRLPLRQEGYGIRAETIHKLCDHISLIITVDNGTSAHEAMSEASQKGIDVIVTDHHQILGENPRCLAFINPKRSDNTYPYPDLAGVGVAFKMVHALHLATKRDWARSFMDYIELATLGTIGDLMPLTGENRVICQFGLRKLNLCPSIIFRKIISKLHLQHVSSSTIGFQIVPLLNSLGRIHDPNLGVEILTNKSIEEKDIMHIIELNKKRKQLTTEQFKTCDEMINEKLLYKQNIIGVYGDFHHGLIGILASKIAEKYHKPAVMISQNGTGSCRSVEGTDFSIVNVLNRCQNHLIRFGGHQAAAGFSISPRQELLNDFFQDIQIAAEKEGQIKPIKKYFYQVSPFNYSTHLYDELTLIEPFGMGFNTPVFLSPEVHIRKAEEFGHHKEHTKLVSDTGESFFLFNKNGLSPGYFRFFYYSSLITKNEFNVDTFQAL